MFGPSSVVLVRRILVSTKSRVAIAVCLCAVVAYLILSSSKPSPRIDEVTREDPQKAAIESLGIVDVEPLSVAMEPARPMPSEPEEARQAESQAPALSLAIDPRYMGSYRLAEFENLPSQIQDAVSKLLGDAAGDGQIEIAAISHSQLALLDLMGSSGQADPPEQVLRVAEQKAQLRTELADLEYFHIVELEAAGEFTDHESPEAATEYAEGELRGRPVSVRKQGGKYAVYDLDGLRSGVEYSRLTVAIRKCDSQLADAGWSCYEVVMPFESW